MNLPKGHENCEDCKRATEHLRSIEENKATSPNKGLSQSDKDFLIAFYMGIILMVAFVVFGLYVMTGGAGIGVH